MPSIKANGINLYYELHGKEGNPVLVLSNGVMMSTASWVYQKNALSEHFRVLLYDCRGMWQSEHPAGPYTMEMHADDLAALLDALNIPTAHIGGISYGSEISMVFALKYPQRTQSLIIIDGVSQIDPFLKGQTYPWLMAAEAQDAELLLRTSYPMNFSEEWISEHLEFIEGSVERYEELDMQALAELMKCFYNLDISDQLEKIKVPTLIVVGEKDVIKGRKYGDLIAERIENSEYVVVPGSGHALCLEKPNELNTLITGFISKHNDQQKEVSN